MILIAGGSGNLGTELKKHFPDALAPTSDEMNIGDYEEVEEFVSRKDVDIVIHCAGMTDTKECEDYPLCCYGMNALATYRLAELCSIYDKKLIYISTDHVFDGKWGDYGENNIPNPQGHYAKSKLMGEWVVLTNPENLVLRTSFMKYFKGEYAFKDKYWSGLWVEEVAEKIAKSIHLKGLYHIGGERKSIYDFVKEKCPGIKPNKIKDNPIARCGLPWLKDTSLDSGKWKNDIGID